MKQLFVSVLLNEMWFHNYSSVLPTLCESLPTCFLLITGIYYSDICQINHCNKQEKGVRKQTEFDYLVCGVKEGLKIILRSMSVTRTYFTPLTQSLKAHYLPKMRIKTSKCSQTFCPVQNWCWQERATPVSPDRQHIPQVSAHHKHWHT